MGLTPISKMHIRKHYPKLYLKTIPVGPAIIANVFEAFDLCIFAMAHCS
jgi:hypothetical protein